MKQVLAVGVAALLIAAALVARGALDDDGGGDGGDGGLVVACVPELRQACEALTEVADLRVEGPAATIEAAVAGEIDAWVTLDPWPAMAAEQQRRDVLGGETVAVASTGAVLLARTAALPAGCAGTADWACVAGATGAAAPTLPRPDTALGALLLGHAARSWSAVARPGEPFAANEFTLPEFEAWLGSLRFAADPVADMIQLAPAGPVATATTGAVARTVVATSREAGQLAASPLAEPASIVVVVVGPAAERVAGQRGLHDALDALGYDELDDPAARTVGLPGPGVLLALQELA